MTFRNPLPVAVVLQPVDGGVLTVRRTIEPRSGWLALPGGYIDWGETWQEAGAREMWEEAGVHIDPSGLREFKVFSAGNATMMVVARATPLTASDLPPFVPNSEASERLILTAPQELAFPLHTEILADFFAGRL
ncbi:MAG: NUDIX domain-containing protein [Caldilineaceae bacterium]|nr:NUDIX domain-containing protein [Caldilineaceae bacterium]